MRTPTRTTLTGIFLLIGIGGAYCMFKADNPLERRMDALATLVGIVGLLALAAWGWLHRRG